MGEILQAEIVAYSSPKEIFVNGLSPGAQRTVVVVECNLIDITSGQRHCPPVKAFGCPKLWKN
jgi:hypothetical protein